MKHNIKVTLFLLGFFLLAQVIGLTLLNKVTVENIVDGQKVVSYDEKTIGEVPKMSGFGFLAYILIGVGVGTALVLLLIKFRKKNIWRVWFFLAVVIATQMALKVVMNEYLAFAIAIILAIFKIYKPNIVVHNMSEVLMYSGIAIFLVPILDGKVLWAALLLIIISVYDFIAVFKSKHMVAMAQFQTESKVFAGLFVPYKVKQAKTVSGAVKDSSEKIAKANINISPAKKSALKALPRFEEEEKTAVLGGGDIAFPLIFSGAVMQSLASSGIPKLQALYYTLIITVATTAALGSLFIFAKKDKFYPAMPIVSIGCFVGYGIVLLLS